MTAQAAQNGKQQPVNPLLLIILGVVVIGGGGFYAYTNFVQPSAAVSQPQPIATPVNTQVKHLVASQNAPPQIIKNQKNDGSGPQVSPSLETTKNETISVFQSSRDPFFPSKLFIDIKKKSRVDPNQTPLPTPGPIVMITSSPSPSQTPPPEIIWEGIISSSNDQVLIIRYKNKPNYLRLGDKLVGTSYIVAEITSNYVVLLSPKDKLQVNRKKEGKSNEQN